MMKYFPLDFLFIMSPSLDTAVILFAKRGRETAALTQSVKDPLCVDTTTVLIAPCGTVVHENVIMILTASIKNATKNTVNVDLIPTVLIGPSAARIYHVLMGKETVIITLIVKEHFSVGMTIV